MKIPTAIILAIGLITSSVILAYGIKNMRNSNYVTVKGLSERKVIADRAWWSINTQVNTGNTKEMQTQISRLEDQITAFLKRNGFTNDEINSPTQSIYQSNYNGIPRLSGDFKMSVSTDDIDKVISAQKETGDLIAAGILLQSEPWSAGPKYYFTRFKELKKDMLAEATKEAKEAAQEFATNSGSSVGKIRRANQGVFQILPGNRTQEDQIFFPEKIVRVVSTVDYFLE